MNLIPVRTPKSAKSLFPDLVWDLPSKEKVIYLTFDDGPTPIITDWTLDVLKQYNAKATFFCIGKNVEAHPDIFNKIIADGHSIGNHTYNHIKGWTTSTENYILNIEKAQKVMSKLIQNSEFRIQNYFRPPYGQIKPKQAKTLIQLGYKIIMWMVAAIDWDASVSKEKCLDNVVNNTISGDIVVFHDSIKAANNMQYALPKVLEYFSEKGFKFKCIPE
ncbi:MAG: polysaccharide deacetylase family protein [Bacteroidetes bacterium]|nr:polysaccharide deacetylase family protein [Bacteroidota bacterium]